ncbi:hypothetical protein AALP_AA5G246400 [Arabis alpina]|uniref:FBD domain-containing protein n=1 Tax=Arabis alpina TaxID=50452 RepID=A0A087GZ57_ARAAL|nr:hypothetical protein AALP_AA5G246400 [Arabis alpina]
MEDQIAQGDEENNVQVVGNATDFITGISNVRILCLSASTVEILTLYCEAIPIPIFSNLTHLTIQSKPEVGWDSLPGLLKNCPVLETLVFQVCTNPFKHHVIIIGDVGDVRLPKLKSLYLKSVKFKEEGIGLSKLLSGCNVLEELVLDDIWSCEWNSCSVSVATLKRLTVNCSYSNILHDSIAKSVLFDVPNLVYLEYTEVIASEYPKVNFRSLVEAKIDLQVARDQSDESSDSKFEDQVAQGNELVGNATDFITGISNVRILCLSASTLEILTVYCEAIPIFSNLTHLSIQSKPEVGWESLPRVLKNCPELETLVFQGLLHKATDKCGDVCLCKPREEEKEEVPSCLSSSPVKVLKILMNNDKIEKQMEQVKHFLETMPHLEQLVLYYESSFDEEVLAQLQIQTRAASPKCKVKLIPGNLSVSSAVPSSVSTKWVSLL